MLTAFDPTAIREYSLASDTEEVKTVFSLGALDHKLAPYIEDKWMRLSLGKGGEDDDANMVAAHAAKRDVDTVRYGLKGWRNFKDKSGLEVSFTTQSFNLPGVGMRSGVTDASMDAIKPFLAELAREIRNDNYVSGAQQKN